MYPIFYLLKGDYKPELFVALTRTQAQPSPCVKRTALASAGSSYYLHTRSLTCGKTNTQFPSHFAIACPFSFPLLWQYPYTTPYKPLNNPYMTPAQPSPSLEASKACRSLPRDQASVRSVAFILKSRCSA